MLAGPIGRFIRSKTFRTLNTNGVKRAYSHRADSALRDAIIPTFHPDYRHAGSPPLPGFRFDRATLEEIRQRLETGGEDAVEPLRKRAAARAPPQPNAASRDREAAVMMLLCEVQERPSVVFTVRAPNLRRHTGEISFPGGLRDDTDESSLHAALRETKEEIGIDSDAVEVLGVLPWLPDLTGRLKVFPYVGYLDLQKTGYSRPSQIPGNPGEVARVFHLTVEQLLDPLRRRDMTFRGTNIKYFGFRADDVDLVPPLPESVVETGDLHALSDYERQHGSTVVWGLTGFVVSEVLRKSLIPTIEQWRARNHGK